MPLALLLGVAALSGACGESGQRAQSQRPAEAGEGGGCLDCGEAGAPAQSGGGSEQAGSSGGGAAPAGRSGAPGTSGGEGGAPAAAAAPDLRLGRISISQTLEIPLMQAGQEVPEAMRPVPLVAGKRALVRAFVELTPEFAERALLGVLDLSSPSGDDTLISERVIAAPSLQEELSTTFVFEVQARDLEVTTTYRLRVLEADTTPLARFPETGELPLTARKREPFKLVLVPLVVTGQAPVAGAPELTALRARITALFPSTGVEVSVKAPLTLDYPLNGDGEGWDDALDDLYALRRSDQPARDVFYYGMLAPDTSYDSYCSGSSCIVGYSNVAEPNDEESRGSIGITVFQDGSGGDEAWDTLAHELGHAMGREHAPCGVDPEQRDPEYPYAPGHLGTVYGFDFDAMALIKPRQNRDIMGYCAPYWTSDYTYRALFERLEYIAGEGFRSRQWSPPESFRVARIGLDGKTTWRGERGSGQSMGRHRAIDLLDAAGRRVSGLDARVVRRDHSRGALIWLPRRALGQAGAVAVDLRPLGGSVLPL
jgi:hypothetical protein